MKRLLTFLLLFGVVAGVSPRSASALAIQAEHRLVAPNLAGQSFEIMVTGGELVSGVNLYAQVGDGGPELADYGLPAGQDGPSISTVDLKLGTVFFNVPDPAVNLGSLPQVVVWSLGIAAQGGKVPAQGRLARLTIDTTGFTEGRWDLNLSNVLAGLDGGPFATDFAGLPANISNGSIRIFGGRAGDTNADGLVDIKDLNNVRNQFGAVGGNPIGDTLPFNGVVGIEDLNAVRNNFGASGAAAVPEPSAWLLSGVCVAMLSAAFVKRRPSW